MELLRNKRDNLVYKRETAFHNHVEAKKIVKDLESVGISSEGMKDEAERLFDLVDEYDDEIARMDYQLENPLEDLMEREDWNLKELLILGMIVSEGLRYLVLDMHGDTSDETIQAMEDELYKLLQVRL